MLQADAFATTAGRADILPPARPLTAIEVEHLRLVATLIGEKPHPITRSWATAGDIEERSRHLHAVMTAVQTYVDAVVRDTADNAPCGSIKARELTGLLADAIGDITGSFACCREEIENDDLARRVFGRV